MGQVAGWLHRERRSPERGEKAPVFAAHPHLLLFCLALSACADAVVLGCSVVEQGNASARMSRRDFSDPWVLVCVPVSPRWSGAIIKILLLQQSDQHPRENEMFSAIILIGTSAPSLFAGPVTTTTKQMEEPVEEPTRLCCSSGLKRPYVTNGFIRTNIITLSGYQIGDVFILYKWTWVSNPVAPLCIPHERTL